MLWVESGLGDIRTPLEFQLKLPGWAAAERGEAGVFAVAFAGYVGFIGVCAEALVTVFAVAFAVVFAAGVPPSADSVAL